jgi:argininosuccinate lyase
MSQRRVWEARTGGGLHPDFQAYSQSIEEDTPFVAHDLAGSIAHVLGLRKAGLVSTAEARSLVDALQSLHREHEAGTFHLDPALEDLHMNIESRLTATLGEAGRRLHTGRSRNDQVATCITLYAREHLASLAQAAHALSNTLVIQARAHARTPWTARTHGQVAQPATLGFLLAAHAFRFHDVAMRTLAAFARVGESPLGCGAVAGSTLPLDPAFTAHRLGLRPPRNALLATGTRDTILEACQAAAQAGFAAASLAQDLLDLYHAGALKLPAGYTTGSSLMPQKRNPDALEMARGRGKAIQGDLAAVTAILAGLGLGYQRDFQLTKPHLTHSLGDATATLGLLAPMLEGAQFDAAVLGRDLAKPSIVATDVAEALVANGMPFRDAYSIVARAYALVESGQSLPAALAAGGLVPADLDAALAATQPDPARRASMGGPAPSRVLESLDALEAEAAATARAVSDAERAAETPFRLLSIPPQTLLEETP